MGRIIVLNTEAYYTVMVVMVGGQAQRPMKQTENPEIHPHKSVQLIIDKNIKLRKDSLFNKWYWINWISIGNINKQTNKPNP